MTFRHFPRWAWRFFAVTILISAATGLYIYQSKCRGADACTAEAADKQERVKPDETQ